MNKEPETNTESEFVLIVEDDEFVLEMMTACIANMGLRCLTAKSITEAVCVLQNNNIILALLDWRLPDGCGGQVLECCKGINPLMPVIVISGMPFDVRTDAIFGRADAFLHKPCGSELVRRYVSIWIERVRASKIFLPKRGDPIVSLEELKNNYIRYVVGLLGGNITQAAKHLGIHRQTVTAAFDT